MCGRLLFEVKPVRPRDFGDTAVNPRWTRFLISAEHKQYPETLNPKCPEQRLDLNLNVERTVRSHAPKGPAVLLFSDLRVGIRV